MYGTILDSGEERICFFTNHHNHLRNFRTNFKFSCQFFVHNLINWFFFWWSENSNFYRIAILIWFFINIFFNWNFKSYSWCKVNIVLTVSPKWNIWRPIRLNSGKHPNSNSKVWICWDKANVIFKPANRADNTSMPIKHKILN